ncbi:hypothetical protein ACFFRR_000178 [Megaselia abdita]
MQRQESLLCLGCIEEHPSSKCINNFKSTVTKREIRRDGRPSKVNDGDTTVACMDGNIGRILLTSAYLAHETTIPPPRLELLTNPREELIICLDANARHLYWGSTECNGRGIGLTRVTFHGSEKQEVSVY